MSNVQKPKGHLVRKLHNFIDRLTRSRARSPVSSQGNNVHDAGSQRTEAIAARASNAALVSVTANPSRGEVNIAANRPSIVIGTATDQVPEVAQDSEGQPVNREHLAPDRVSATTKDTLRTTWHGVELVLKKVEGLLAGTPLKTPIGAINVLIDLTNAVIDNKDALEELIDQTANRLNVVNSALLNLGEEDTEFRKIIEEFAHLLIKKVLEIRAMSEKVTWKKLLENEKDKAKIGEIFKKIDENTNTFFIQCNVKIEKNTRLLQESLDWLKLNSWQYSDKATYDAIINNKSLARGACTEGTRVGILKQLYEWAQNASAQSPQVFWLTGQAGSGKSTIAFSVAKYFDGGNKVPNILQASFFCSRQFEDTRSRGHIIPTLVYQLAHNSKSFAQSLFYINKLDSAKKLGKQMKDLLVDPWQHFINKQFKDIPPYLVVIDALDEIQDGEGSEFLEELLKTVKNGNEVNADILKYLKDKLSALKDDPGLPIIVQQASGLFIYASTVVKYIKPNSSLTRGEQQKLLQQLLHSSTNEQPVGATRQIDNLYGQILSEAFTNLQTVHIQARLMILHNLLCAQERISISIAARLSDFDDIIDMEECAEHIVQELHAVLYIKEGKVFWYHASFPDFVFTPERFNVTADYLSDGHFSTGFTAELRPFLMN
ncbi:hypothetical protein C0995_004165 [Termitomyces sp. Mi166|nr:hypothetical protein C0995_004165 [Termitomyces sp. Mi166\